jgi:putative two-component system hydrogenase maturation factor HypX/HoxX
LFGEPCRLFDAWPEDRLRGGAPGDVIAWRETAILRATVDGALWIGHVRREEEANAEARARINAKPEADARTFKLPATQVLATQLASIPEAPLAGETTTSQPPAEPGRTSATKRPGRSASCISTSTTAP